MDFISNLGPSALIKSVSSVGSEISQRVKTASAPPQRPFRVCSHDRSVRKGVTAGTLRELLAKEFFDTLEDGSVIMVLEQGEKWIPRKIMPP
uniref:CIDE-N domain-containing protein n=1 Tax=Pyxicephalus adspersus TaxID=30357 RepID=A0AAV3B1L0_PYXAD|nr:TPA: hypothetical protein GDO54_001848 [Pyxicephalus adspersus]